MQELIDVFLHGLMNEEQEDQNCHRCIGYLPLFNGFHPGERHSQPEKKEVQEEHSAECDGEFYPDALPLKKDMDSANDPCQFTGNSTFPLLSSAARTSVAVGLHGPPSPTSSRKQSAA